MQKAKPWHEHDEFWITTGPLMFSERRWAAAPKEVDRIVSLLGIEPGAYILDLCCGVGRHSLELARRGFRVTGVDRTRSYLESASRRAEAEGLQVAFIQEDMRTFCRPSAFDAVINMFTSFGYFDDPEEDRQVVMNVCRSLKSGGAFLLEMHGKETLARIFRARDWREENGVLFLVERKVTRNWGWMENRWIIVKDEGRREFNISHRLYSAAELSCLLRACGFAEVDVFGDLEGHPYDQTARRLVVIAHR